VESSEPLVVAVAADALESLDESVAASVDDVSDAEVLESVELAVVSELVSDPVSVVAVVSVELALESVVLAVVSDPVSVEAVDVAVEPVEPLDVAATELDESVDVAAVESLDDEDVDAGLDVADDVSLGGRLATTV
jgi:hypothetical protein